MKKEIRVNINGEKIQAQVEPWELLSDFLRDGLGLTGTKVACEMGDCGACTVLLDGRAVNSCLILAVDVNHKEITDYVLSSLRENKGGLEEYVLGAANLRNFLG